MVLHSGLADTFQFALVIIHGIEMYNWVSLVGYLYIWFVVSIVLDRGIALMDGFASLIVAWCVGCESWSWVWADLCCGLWRMCILGVRHS